MKDDTKNVFITGVSSGIGYDACRFLIEKGYRVFGSVRKKADAQRLSNTMGERFFPLIFDVTQVEKIRASADVVGSQLGDQNLAALVNNAGLSVPGPLHLIPDDDFRYQMDVNVMGVRNVTNAFLPLLGTQQSNNPGKIINISSVSGRFNAPFNGAYCISKHALESMSDIYRRELMLYGIDVIVIEPGPIKSDIWKKNKGKLRKYEDSDYGFVMKRADKIIEHSEKNALPAERISRLIWKVIEKNKPRTRYIVHKKGILLLLLSKFAPDRLVDKMIWRNIRGADETRYKPV